MSNWVSRLNNKVTHWTRICPCQALQYVLLLLTSVNVSTWQLASHVLVSHEDLAVLELPPGPALWGLQGDRRQQTLQQEGGARQL